MNPPGGNARRFFPEKNEDDLSSFRHRQLLGWIGVALPFIVWFISGFRPSEGLAQWEPLSSISAYFYTGSVPAFVGELVAIALFLFTYNGYKNDYVPIDRIASCVAGGAAILVASFPTEAPPPLTPPVWWTPMDAQVHTVSAIVLFGSFAFFALILFPRSKPGQVKDRGKRARNIFYYSCGAGILVSLGWAGFALQNHEPVFWPETSALLFFGVSWLVKGRVDTTVPAVGGLALHSVLHPRESFAGATSAIRGKNAAPPTAPKSDA